MNNRLKSITSTPRPTRGWPPARREAQTARCRAMRPSRFATGPRSVAGKRRVALNAVRHGHRSAPMRQVHALLAAQRRFIADLNRQLRDVRRMERARQLAERGDGGVCDCIGAGLHAHGYGINFAGAN